MKGRSRLFCHQPEVGACCAFPEESAPDTSAGCQPGQCCRAFGGLRGWHCWVGSRFRAASWRCAVSPHPVAVKHYPSDDLVAFTAPGSTVDAAAPGLGPSEEGKAKQQPQEQQQQEGTGSLQPVVTVAVLQNSWTVPSSNASAFSRRCMPSPEPPGLGDPMQLGTQGAARKPGGGRKCRGGGARFHARTGRLTSESSRGAGPQGAGSQVWGQLCLRTGQAQSHLARRTALPMPSRLRGTASLSFWQRVAPGGGGKRHVQLHGGCF